jgi:DNA repair protein RadC
MPPVPERPAIRIPEAARGAIPEALRAAEIGKSAPGAPINAEALAAQALAQTPSFNSAQLTPEMAVPGLATSGADLLTNPFVRPEGVPAGAPTDLSSLFGQGQAGLGPIDTGMPGAGPSMGMMPPEPADLGQAGLAMPQGQAFAPQAPAFQAPSPFQAPQISGATTLGELVSRGLGGHQPAFQPQVAPMAAFAAPSAAMAQPAMAVPAPAPAFHAAAPLAPHIAQPMAPAPAPAGMASLFAQPSPVVQAPQQPYVPAPVQQPAAPSYQPPVQAPAPLPAPVAAAAPAPLPAPIPAPVAPAPVQQAAPAQQQPVRRGTPLQADPYAVNPREDYPEALAARRANQRADGGVQNDPGRPYIPAPYERPDEPAPIEQPAERPAEAPAETPELEPAFAGSPLQNTRPVPSSIENGDLSIHGGSSKLRFSKGQGIPQDMLMRVGLTRAVLSQFVDRSVIGEMTVPDRPMDNADDVAALAYEYLRKQPQENFMAVILDGQGRPIQILRHTLGAISSTNFVPHVIAGVAASTRGARTVYMVHNHPSTTTRFSDADLMAARSLSKTIESIGLRFGGSLVVTDGDAVGGNMVPKYIFHPGNELVNHNPAAYSMNLEAGDQRVVHNVIPFDDRPGESSMHPGEEGGLPSMAKIQVVERMFELRKDALFPRVTQPKDAIEQIPPLLSNLPGVALLDAAGRLVGVIQMSINEMRFAASNGDSIINKEQGQGRDYIGSEAERANPEQDKRVYKRTDFGRDTQEGSWNNPLAMLMAALERSNAERVIISVGPNDIGMSNNDTRSQAVRNLQRAILRTSSQMVTIDDVINNRKNFANQVISKFQYGSFDSADTKGVRFSTGQRGGFNEEASSYGAEGEQAPIENGPKSLGDVVKRGMEGEGVSETNPDDPNAQAEFDRQEREAGARVNPPSSPENAQPAEPIIKKTRKPRAPKAAAVSPTEFPRTLDTTPGAFGRLSGEQMKKFGLSDAVLDQFIEHSLVTNISSGVDKVKTVDDAAHVVAGMRKRPQEMIVLLITDSTGKPIQIAQHQLGGPASAGFNPGILIGTAASTPGAANVFFIHNHPSFKASLSPADIGAGNAVENLCKAAGLKYMGTMAIAGSNYAVMDNSGQILGGQKIKPLPRKFTIPVTERMFSYHVAQGKESFSDPSVAAPVLLKTFGPDQPGIVLVDNSNRPVAAIPMAADVLQAMRAYIPGTKQTGFSKFVAGVERSGGVNAFIYTAGLQGGERVKMIENVSKVCNATKITALDAIDNQGVTHSRHIIGYSTDFQEPSNGYNRGENAQENAAEGGVENAAENAAEKPGSIKDIVEQGLSEPQKKKTRR